MKKQIELKCPICQISYFKAKSEYTRNLKLNRSSYCSLSCSLIGRQTKLQQGLVASGNRYNISNYAGNQADTYTSFRYLFKGLNNFNRKEVLVTLQDLKSLWEFQKSKCAFSGLNMVLPTHTNYKEVSFFEAASIDRIDNDLPYCITNIQYVLRPLNLAKNKSSNKEFLAFLNVLRHN
jgi:hypothetical protein